MIAALCIVCFCLGMAAGAWMVTHWVRGQVNAAARLREMEEEERRKREERKRQ